MKFCPSCRKRYPLSIHDCPQCTRTLVIKSGTVVAERFTIRDLIATGGMSQIYLARQHAIARDVALKVVYAGPSHNQEMVMALRNEAFLAGQVSHPHIVAVYDHGTFEGGHLYLAMEYLQGRTLYDALTKDGPFKLPIALRLLMEIAEALAVVHEAGLVHRDLKPSNVFLVSLESGREFVKLLDFGLVTAARPAWFFPRAHGRSGTPLYMSPEQIRGDPLDARSDLYALGLVAYEMLVGKPVFPGLDPFEEHLHSVPVPIRIAAPSVRVPRALDDLILRLLSKDPRRRPRNVSEVMERLRQVASGLVTGPNQGAGDQAEDSTVSITLTNDNLHFTLYEPTFVGREKEKAVFKEALEKLARGFGTVLWFIGERGSGKSALLACFQKEAAAAGYKAVICSRSTHGPLLGSWRPVITGLLGLENPSHEDVIEAAGQQLGLLENDFIAQGIADIVVPGPAVREFMVRDREVLVGFLQTALEGFLRIYAAKFGPFVALLDDIHEADRDSVVFLERLLKSLKTEPASICVVVTSQPISRAFEADRPWLRRAVASVRGDSACYQIGPLTDAEIRGLMDSMSPYPCSPALRKVVRAAAAGNPFFAVQMFRHLLAKGAITVSRGHLQLVQGVEITAPEALAELVAARVEALRLSEPDGASCADLLKRIVILGPWATVPNVFSVLEREGRSDLCGAFDSLCDLLAAEGFVTRVSWPADDLLVLAHPLFSEVIRKEPVVSADIKLRLIAAQVIEESCGGRISTAASYLGRLYKEAGYLDKATDLFLMAAEAALEDSCLGEAENLFKEVQGCLKRLGTSNDERLLEALLSLAEIHFIEGRYDQSREDLEAVSRMKLLSQRPQAMLQFLELQARVAEALREADNVIHFAKQLINVAEKTGDRHRVARSLLLQAAITLEQGKNAEAATLIERAEELIGADGDSTTMGYVYLARSRLHMKLGPSAQCLDIAKKALSIFSGPRHFAERAQALFFLGARLVTLERRAEALEVFEEGVKLCERTGFVRGLAAHLANLGTCLGHLGRIEEGLEVVRRSLELREQMGDKRGVAHSLTALSDLALLRQSYTEAKTLAEKALRICEQYDYPVGKRVALLNLGLAEMGLRRFDAAAHALYECLSTLEEDRYVDPAIPMAHEQLANLFERQGMAEGALKHRLKAVKLYEAIERYEDAERVKKCLAGAH